ncbi:MAG: hypothetical protein IKM73_10345, partial [Acidaminococcaceae bacterium]|nr:hypothetical protein [Acidaminococcaceae bacterium]
MKSPGQEGEIVMNTVTAANTSIIPTEHPTLRTAFAKTYAVGPGKYTAFQSAIQIHARRGGEWQEVDARFRERDGALVSEGPVLTVACVVPGEKDFLTVTDEKGRRLTLGLEGAQPVKPEIPEPGKIETEDPAEYGFLTAQANAQGTLLFHEIYPGVTLCCHTNGQLASTFAFASPEA